MSAKDPSVDYSFAMSMPRGFANIGRLILRDLNSNTSSPTFYKYTKEQIIGFLKDPYKNQQNIRDAIIHIYAVSAHFRRLIQYFTSLTDLSYVVSPFNTDTTTAKVKSTRKNYNKTQDFLASMDIKNQFEKVVTACLREDVFYGTAWITSGSVIIQQLPTEYCGIAVIEDNVLNVSFDFSYFDSRQALLDMYPDEFRIKYGLYQTDRMNKRWQELDAPNSFAVKCSNDILTHAIPPFAGILRDIYELEDFRDLRLTKAELENYAMLVMKLGIDSNGDWELDYKKAKQFFDNLSSVLPDEVGAVLSPMEISKIGFERTNSTEINNVTEAEQNMYTAAGTSSLLFNNAKAAASALKLSIQVDQALTYGIVKSIEGVVNRLLHRQSFGRNFKATFLDVSRFNRKEAGDAYIKACQFGIPMVSYYAASQGMSQVELDCMNFLENDVLDFRNRFMPLQSSSTMSSSGASTNSPGRPTKDDDELTESGDISRERE